MTIATTIIRRTKIGNMKLVVGYSVLSGTTNTGDVTTGLNHVEMFIPITSGAAQKGIAVNETLDGNLSDPVTVVTEANDATFGWIAIGQ